MIDDVHGTEGAVVAEHGADRDVLRHAHLELDIGDDEVYFLDVGRVAYGDIDEAKVGIVSSGTRILLHGWGWHQADLKPQGIVEEAGGLVTVGYVGVGIGTALAGRHSRLRVLQLAEEGGADQGIELGISVGPVGHPPGLALAGGRAQEERQMEIRGHVTVVAHGDADVVGIVDVLLSDEGRFGGNGRNYLAVDFGAAVSVIGPVEVL